MMRLAAALCALALCASAQAGTDDFRCLKSVGTNKPLLLQFDFPARKGGPGYVTYRSGSGRIPVRLAATEEEAVPDRPSEFTTVWKEAGGTYTMVSQGARIYGFRFVRARDGKVFEFGEDLESFGERGCAWNGR